MPDIIIGEKRKNSPALTLSLSFLLPFSGMFFLFLTNRALMPFPSVLLIGAAGTAFALFLETERGENGFPTVLFSLSYALSSTLIVSAQESVADAAVAVLFPLILLGVRTLLIKYGFFLLTVTLSVSFLFATHFSYLAAVGALMYLLYLLISEKETAYTRCLRVAFFIVSFILALLISSFRLFPYLASLDFGAFFTAASPMHYAALPDAFFPAAFDTVTDGGSPLFYAGIAALLFVPVFFASGSVPLRDKLTEAALPTAVLLLLCLPHTASLLQILGDLAVYRYAGAFLFVTFFLRLADKGLRLYLTEGSSVPAFSAAGIILLFLIAEKLAIETPETVKDPAPILNDPLSACLVVGSTILILFFTTTVKQTKKPWLFALILFIALTETTLSARVVLSRSAVEAADYDITHSETSTVSYKAPRDVAAACADCPFYLYRDADSGVIGYPSALGEPNSDSLAEFFRLFGASYENGVAEGVTPALETVLGIVYGTGRTANENGLYEEYAVTVRGRTVYKNPMAVPLGISAQNYLAHWEPDPNGNPFTVMNDFLSVLLGTREEIFFSAEKETDADSGTVTLIAPDSETAVMYIYDGTKIREIHTENGVFRLTGLSESEAAHVTGAIIDADACTRIADALASYAATPNNVSVGEIDANIYITAGRTFLFTSLPYSGGFTVTVNGEPAQTENFYGMLAVPLEKTGYLHLVFSFTPQPMRTAGISPAAPYLSFLGLALFITAGVCAVRFSPKISSQKKEDNL